eukprot:7545291-Pyramimonas_sp.AAC.1
MIGAAKPRAPTRRPPSAAPRARAPGAADDMTSPISWRCRGRSPNPGGAQHRSRRGYLHPARGA